MVCDQRAANRGAAKGVPVFLLAIVVYACYAFTKPLCIDHLLRPTLHDGTYSSRKGVGAGLLAGFYILLVPMAASFIRLITTIVWNPGFLPRGPGWLEQQTETPKESGKKWHSRGRRKHGSRAGPKKREGEHHNDDIRMADNNVEKADVPFDAAGLEAFHTNDVFVCQTDGKPPWCSTCCQWKTDRTHHCSEAGRCVRKMDHFCPWVGGVVAETSFKFFLQFLLYGSLFTVYILIVMAIFVAELSREGRIDVHFVLALALSGFLGLFAVGMFFTSAHLASTNTTTIESLNRAKVWTLAVLIPRPNEFYASKPPQWTPPFATVSYLVDSSVPETPGSPRREFAILHSRPGENPFDLGSLLANLRDVMGHSILDWFIPLKLSPCVDHGRRESVYALGPALQRMKQEAGLEGSSDTVVSPVTRERRRESRSRRSIRGCSNGGARSRSLREGSSRARSHRSHRSHHRRHQSANGSRDNTSKLERASSQGRAGPG